MPDADVYRVEASALNLRSEPIVSAATRLATLPQGHRVARIGVASDPDWWNVRTRLGESPVEGVVAHRFLKRVDDIAPPAATVTPAATASLPAPHLTEDRNDITRSRAGGRAYPLGESGRPRRTASQAATRVRQLGEIVDWLRVERSARYRKGDGATFCNIYAYDYCYLAGAYLPRVWWTADALARIGRGEAVEVKYAATTQEQSANALYDWLELHGASFGWTRTFDLDAFQAKANAGQVAILCAQRSNRNASGHIVAVVPERGSHAAQRGSDGVVTRPLQSQAGARNFRYDAPHWWTHSKFHAFGFWLHD